jgi:uncharacterized protein (DUF58 family)
MIASRFLYFLLILGAVPIAAGWWWPGLMRVALIYDIVLALLLGADYLLTQRGHLITATRKVTERLSIGRPNAVELSLVNYGNSDLHCLLRDDFPQAVEADTEEFDFILPAGAKADLRYFLIPRRRGAFQFTDIYVRYLSFLRLFWRQVRVKADCQVKVFSDLRALQELSVKLSCSSELGELRKLRRGRGTEFASLKEYTVGDDSRSIDWKATARHDRPVVRIYEAEQEQNLLILIDAGRMMLSDLDGLTRFDHALNSALGLALAGLSRNDQVGIGIFADKPLLYMPPRRGKAYLKKMLEAVFALSPKMVEPDYVGCLSYFASAQKGRSLMVVITDLTDPSGSQTLLSGLASLSPRHLPFCVTLKDRHLDTCAADHSLSIDRIYRRAVASDLLSQRELALSVLTRRGCLVLDCPPQELTSKLVDRYLEIKARGRL